MIIVGLGNPEEEYKNTRHNIGFKVLDSFPNLKFEKISEKSMTAELGKLIFLKPQTGMNSSGEAVKEVVEKTGDTDVLIIVDDLDLPFGDIRLRSSGSSRHNGLKSVEKELGTQNYMRIRVGIGHNFETGKQLEYVLGNFTKQEESHIQPILRKIREAILDIVRGGIEKAMNKYNSNPPKP